MTTPINVDQPLMAFMSEARSFLGLESISVKNNDIQLVDYSVYPMYEVFQYQLKFQRVESAKVGETLAEQQQDYLETVQLTLNLYRSNSGYVVEVDKDKNNEPKEEIVQRVKYHRKPANPHKVNMNLPDALKSPEQQADDSIQAKASQELDLTGFGPSII